MNTSPEPALASSLTVSEFTQDGATQPQRLAWDRQRVLKVVPYVVGVATLTLVAWLLLGPTSMRWQLALWHALCVLIIGCPLALAVAVPSALKQATKRAAQLGVQVEDAQAWERINQITTVVFEKTGTITQGRPIVSEVVTTGDFSEDEVLSLAAATEGFCEHPLGEAIVRAAQKRSLLVPPARDFYAKPGFGVMAVVDDRHITWEVLVGNTRLMHKHSINLAPFELVAAHLKIRGQTTVFVAVNGLAAGVIALADKIKPNASNVIERLHKQGLEVALLTGDTRSTAEHIASEAGIGWVMPEVLPGDRSAQIKQLQSEGKVVAVVADGFNDAPALAQADLSIATGTLTPRGGAHIILDDDLCGMTRAIALSQATQQTIRQNLTFSYIYTAASIPLAAGLLYPFTGWRLSPVFAAAILALSGVCVLVNSRRIGQFVPRENDL